MSENYVLGFFWLFVAGTTAGSFVLPMKFVRRWKWEHLWLVYSVIAFFILLPAVALASVHHVWQAYEACSFRALAATALFGAGWGIGSVLFGLCVETLGMALGFSMVTGIYAALGAIVPLMILTPDLVWTQNGLLIVGGNIVMIAGVVVCAIAGDRRDKQMSRKEAPGTLNPKLSFPVALTLCILSGVFSAMLNFGFAFGMPIVDAARNLGSTKDEGVYAVWLLVVPAGGILNVGYCLYLLARRRTWSLLWRDTVPQDWFHAFMMAFLWSGSLIFYGWGADHLGRLGPSLGWSLWNAILIITTFVCGLLTDEWRGAARTDLGTLLVGIAVLIVATIILGLGGAGA